MTRKNTIGTTASIKSRIPRNRHRSPSCIAKTTANTIASGISHTGSKTRETIPANLSLSFLTTPFKHTASFCYNSQNVRKTEVGHQKN